MNDADQKRQVRAALPHARAGMLSRPKAAKLLGISFTAFRRREEDGIYQPTHVDERGWRYYSRAYLESKASSGKREQADEELTRRTQELAAYPLRSIVTYAPDEATRVFGELEKDEDLVRVVRATGLHPDAVVAIHESWLLLRRRGGGYHLSAKSLQALDQIPADGFPARSEEELVAAVGALAEQLRLLAAPCRRCRSRPSRTVDFCRDCEAELAAKTPAFGGASG